MIFLVDYVIGSEKRAMDLFYVIVLLGPSAPKDGKQQILKVLKKDGGMELYGCKDVLKRSRIQKPQFEGFRKFKVGIGIPRRIINKLKRAGHPIITETG